MEITTNGIAFPFCGEKCAQEFKRNKLDYLYCPWKPTQKVNPSISADVYGNTVYFCCIDCRDNAKVFVAIQTNEFGFFGVRIKIDQVRARQNLDNFPVVADVLRNSPAAKLGVEKGSVLLKIGGMDMNDYRKVIKWMRLSKSGQEVLFEIKTPDGKTKELKVVLGNRGKYRGSLIN
ncbi:MAG: PDZ domain-containing protein [Planctomycetota bacterium]